MTDNAELKMRGLSTLAASIIVSASIFALIYAGSDYGAYLSVDGGLNYTELELHAGWSSGDASDNPSLYLLNISTIAGSQMDVRIYFRMQGLWDYWWHMDDFRVIEGPQNEIVLAEVTNAWFDGNYGYVGSFNKLPAKHIFENVCFGDVYSNGEVMQTGVTLEATITNSLGTVVFNDTDDTIQLSYTDTAALFIGTQFTPPSTPDVYTVTVKIKDVTLEGT